MADLTKVRVQLLNTDTGEVIEDVDVLTSSQAVVMTNGKTLQEVVDDGQFGYDDTELRELIKGKANTNHTHTSSQVGLGNVTNDKQVKASEKGVAGGVATLGDDGKVPTAQLPSYVDDVLEFDTKSAFPNTGESGKIYVDKSTNKTYRWSGSAYVEISASLALGETSSTAYAGDKGKTTTDNVNKILNGTTVVPKAQDSATVNGKTVGVNVPSDAKFTDTVYTHPTHTAKSSGLYKVTVDSQGHVSGATAVSKSDITALGIPAQDTKYNVASESSDGLMSSSDKAKLNDLQDIEYGTDLNKQKVKLFFKVV